MRRFAFIVVAAVTMVVGCNYSSSKDWRRDERIQHRYESIQNRDERIQYGDRRIRHWDEWSLPQRMPRAGYNYYDSYGFVGERAGYNYFNYYNSYGFGGGYAGSFNSFSVNPCINLNGLHANVCK